MQRLLSWLFPRPGVQLQLRGAAERTVHLIDADEDGVYVITTLAEMLISKFCTKTGERLWDIAPEDLSGVHGIVGGRLFVTCMPELDTRVHRMYDCKTGELLTERHGLPLLSITTISGAKGAMVWPAPEDNAVVFPGFLMPVPEHGHLSLCMSACGNILVAWGWRLTGNPRDPYLAEMQIYRVLRVKGGRIRKLLLIKEVVGHEIGSIKYIHADGRVLFFDNTYRSSGLSLCSWNEPEKRRELPTKRVCFRHGDGKIVGLEQRGDAWYFREYEE